MRNAYQMLALDARNKKAPYSWIKYIIMMLFLAAAALAGVWLLTAHKAVATQPTLSPVVTVLYEHDLWTLRVSSAGPIDAEVVGEGTIVDGVRYVPIKREGSSLVWNLVVLGTNTLTVGQKIQVYSHYHTGGVPGPGSVIYILAQ